MKIPSYFLGQVRDVASLTPADVRVEHAASCLAKVNRYNGNTPVPYSVAQHAVLVAELCGRCMLAAGGAPQAVDWARYEGLHHDTTEAYMGDIMGPLKNLLHVTDGRVWSAEFTPVRDFEANMRRLAVAPALGLDLDEPAFVHSMDMLARQYEQVILQGRTDVRPPAEVWGLTQGAIARDFLRPMHWRAAERAFMEWHLACMPGTWDEGHPEDDADRRHQVDLMNSCRAAYAMFQGVK